MSLHGMSPAAIVEAQASGMLDTASVASALSELDERMAGIRSWYPRCNSLAVFIAGPATLAFLVGRAINQHIFPSVQMFQYRDYQYQLAYEAKITGHIDDRAAFRSRVGEHEFAYETRSRRKGKQNTILWLASNPSSTPRLILDEEAHDIQRELERSQHRDRFEFQSQLAPRAMELRRHLQTLSPTVVHFSGHGEAGGLVFHDDGVGSRVVSPDDIRELFRLARTRVKVVVLNACFSEAHAEALLECVDCVVGMTGPILDESAKHFAIGFYEGLGDRMSIQDAYENGCLSIRLRGSSPVAMSSHGVRDVQADSLVSNANGVYAHPRLRSRSGVDPSRLILAADLE